MPKSYFSIVADPYPEILLKNASWNFSMNLAKYLF